MMDKRPALLPKKREAFIAIKRFMMDGDVTLRDEEEKILNRWIFTDALLKAKDLDEEGMIAKIVEQFTVSPFTARNDIYYTQRLFADSRKIVKKYLIHHHLDRIDQDIQRLRKLLFNNKKKVGEDVYDYVPDAKELAALAKLHETYTYTLNSMPEDAQLDKQPPPVFQFILAPGQVIDKPMMLEDAKKQATDIIMKQNPDGTYEAE